MRYDGPSEPVALGGGVDDSGAEQWPVRVLWTRTHLPHAGQRIP